ncbi:DNA-binding protein [Kitasatospora acidiphila]|uniref:DNA-binding protein n=1 Tax=Kitasatospora acidiphila TaxID=2567942 RepID=UPI003C7237B8
MPTAVAANGSQLTRVEALTADEVYALPALVPLWPDAAAALGGMSRAGAYAAAASASFPVPCIKIGRSIRVRRSDLLHFLGLATEPEHSDTRLLAH